MYILLKHLLPFNINNFMRLIFLFFPLYITSIRLYIICKLKEETPMKSNISVEAKSLSL